MRVAICSVLAAILAAGAMAVAQTPGMQPAATRAYTVEPFTPAPGVLITINGDGVRLRAEPFATKESQVLSSGSTGLPLTVVGIARQPDWDWYQVILRNGQKAFIRSDLTSAPSRGGSSPAAVSSTQPVAQPVQPPVYAPPATVTPPSYVPANTPPSYQPQPVQPQLQPQPSTSGGAISLTPGAVSPQLGPPPTTPPASEPQNNGLLSVSPTAPTPRFSNPAPAPAAPEPVDVSPRVTAAPTASSTTSGLGVAEQIRAQLNLNRCWTDSSNMMDAHRLRAVFGVSFAPNGKFAAEPRLVEPATEPANDPAMMVFIAKARAALRTCNAVGFNVPQSYYSGGQGELQLEFSAR